MLDLKGFAHNGADWSWPEYDELGFLTRPAHAHAGRQGVTACGEAWPHAYDPVRRRVGRAPAPTDPPDYTGPDQYVPSVERVQEIRWAEDRTRFLCPNCLGALGVSGKITR